MKSYERRCFSDPIDDCECESFRALFSASRSQYQLAFYSAYDDYRMEIEGSIKTNPNIYFSYVNLKKYRVGFPAAMIFENKTALTNKDKCELFAEFTRSREMQIQNFGR
jgi:hypothetical protein